MEIFYKKKVRTSWHCENHCYKDLLTRKISFVYGHSVDDSPKVKVVSYSEEDDV